MVTGIAGIEPALTSLELVILPLNYIPKKAPTHSDRCFIFNLYY